MYLPNKLPKGVRTGGKRGGGEEEEGIGEHDNDHHHHNQHQLSSSSVVHRMGKGRGKKAADRDQMLGGPQSPTTILSQQQQQPSTSAATQQQHHGGFVARSWARISGRRRRQKRRMLEAMEEEEVRRREQRVATTMTIVVDSSNVGGNGGRHPSTTTATGGGGDGMPLSTVQQQQQGSSWVMMPGAQDRNNLSGLAHLAEEQQQGQERRENDVATRGGQETQKRHFLGRGMDRLRRSIRRTLHRGHSSSSQSGQAQALTHPSAVASSDLGGAGGGGGQPCPSSLLPSSATAAPNGPAGTGGGNNGGMLSKSYCHSDEIAVRSSACSFPVKYLGSCEVFESRGMSVCESALQHLRSRKRATKALLYVSGDGIRVVDQESNRGLIVDQTIEKVSFCSPDRHNDHGFAYICRDGATRRWMCHGFYSTKDSGERLSHAVGCAFTVCLEKKRKRDAETEAHRNAQALAANGNESNSQQQLTNNGGANPQQTQAAVFDGQEQFARTNQAYKSFRQLSISERRADPQKAILVVDNNINNKSTPTAPMSTATVSFASAPVRTQSVVDLSTNSFAPIIHQNGFFTAATPRPVPNPTLFQQTGSLRAPLGHHTNQQTEIVPSVPGQQQQLPQALFFNRFNSLQHGGGEKGNENMRKSMPRMSLHNEPIWEGEDDANGAASKAMVVVANKLMSTENGNPPIVGKWNGGGGGIGPDDAGNKYNRQNRFYRTLPHSLPNFGQGINSLALSSGAVPPAIPEKEKLPQSNYTQQNAFGAGHLLEMSSNSPPADPFTDGENIISEFAKVRADDWLEQTFQRASSLHYPTLLPRSATVNWPPAEQQQLPNNWARFPQSQSSNGGQDWPDGSNRFAAVKTTPANCPPAQPPPPLPSFISTPLNNAKQQISMPNPFNVTLLSSPPAVVTTNKTSEIANLPPQPTTPPDGAKNTKQQQQKQSEFIKTHGKKPSASRQIEYQLLQETDVSLSPPRGGGECVLERTAVGYATVGTTEAEENGKERGEGGGGEVPNDGPTTIDPFDVNWSQKVLAETAKQRSSSNNKKEGEEKQNNRGSDLGDQMTMGGGRSERNNNNVGGSATRNAKGEDNNRSGTGGNNVVVANPFGWDMAPSASVNV